MRHELYTEQNNKKTGFLLNPTTNTKISVIYDFFNKFVLIDNLIIRYI